MFARRKRDANQSYFHFILQHSNAADLNSETSLNCNGKEFKCVNQTHFQLCSPNGNVGEGLTSIDGVVESCIAGQKCDDGSLTHCGVNLPSNRKHQLKGSLIKRPSKRIRLIKGNRASNWRPRLSLQTDKQKEYAAKLRERLIKQRRKQEIFIDSVLAKQSTKPKQKQKQKKKQIQKQDQSASVEGDQKPEIDVDITVNENQEGKEKWLIFSQKFLRIRRKLLEFDFQNIHSLKHYKFLNCYLFLSLVQRTWVVTMKMVTQVNRSTVKTQQISVRNKYLVDLFALVPVRVRPRSTIPSSHVPIIIEFSLFITDFDESEPAEPSPPSQPSSGQNPPPPHHTSPPQPPTTSGSDSGDVNL